MKNLQKLQEVAEVLAALDLKSSFPEAVAVIRDKMAELEELPLPVVYVLPLQDGSVLRQETRTFCPSLPCSAIRIGQYCLETSTDWTVRWDKRLEEKQEEKDAPLWQLPPLSVLSHLSKKMVDVNAVLGKFGLHLLHRGWYRSCEKDENGEMKVVNILTGKVVPESEVTRYDICSRFCYFCGE